MPRRKTIREPAEEAEFKKARREKRNEQQRNRRKQKKNENLNLLVRNLIEKDISAESGTSNSERKDEQTLTEVCGTQSSSSNISLHTTNTPHNTAAGANDVSIQNIDMSDTVLHILNNHDTIYENYIGQMDIICQHCLSRHFALEQVSNKKNSFNECCRHGEVKLEPMPEPPVILKSLFEGTHEKSKNFFDRIRNYNSSFSFASFNANLYNLSSQRRGPYCFKIQGQIYYQMNTALYPPIDETPSYGQLFIVDTNEAAEIRLNQNIQCDLELFKTIDSIIRDHNVFAESYQMMKDVIESNSTRDSHGNVIEPELSLLFTLKPGMDARRYNFQRVNEVAAIFSTTADGEIPESYITVANKNTKTLQRLSTMDPNTEPWVYPLFYPHGNQGWHSSIPYTKKTTRRVTRADYYKYKLAIRDEFNVFLMGRRLTQQWVVDSYVKIEKDRLNYCRFNQTKLRAESYKGLLDHLKSRNENGNTPCNIGKVVILPSTFTCSPRNMLQHYQDAMSIVRKFGKPDLFITMTCNPKWIEITENLLPGQTASDRPDLVARVFDIKKNALIKLITKTDLFGKVIAYNWVIEFQKRGLPHLHMLLTLQSGFKIKTPDIVDRFICAEIPIKDDDPRLYDIVTRNMLHGPCGDWCLIDGKCSKKFPKAFRNETVMDENGYPLYQRKNDGMTFTRNNEFFFDNQYVVPYNRTLLLTFNCHINVEVVSSVKAVKYLYKYFFKGHDKAAVTINSNLHSSNSNATHDTQHPQNESDAAGTHDEIRDFVDARYVGPVEAVWRISSKSLQDKSHSIIRLPVHLQNEQNITITEDFDEIALQEALQKQTMLIDYFKLNERNAEAKQYTYSEIPHHYVFKKIDDTNNYNWQPRRKHFNVIGRMYSISPAQIELFHLRLLLVNVKGAISYEGIRTVNGEVFDTFTSACLALGLIEDDQEWKRTMTEAVVWMMPRQLRCLFVRILIHCQPLYPEELWEQFKGHMSEDFYSRFGVDGGNQRAYRFINFMLNKEGVSLSTFPKMLQIDETEGIPDDFQTQNSSNDESEAYYRKLNIRQKEIVDFVIQAINDEGNHQSNCIYIDGPGGSGKTFIYTTLCHLLKIQCKVVSTMAYTGIAATLLPNGKTVHKTFGLPVPMFTDSSSNVKPNSNQGRYLKSVDVFIWDEAPMSPRYALEIIDRTLRHIMNIDVPFGGKMMILGGDFRQLLPVLTHATRSEMVNLSIKYSHLWRKFHKFTLTQNMRALPEEIGFSQFLLDVGDGKLNDVNDNLLLPDECPVSKANNIIEYLYGNIIRTQRFNELTKSVILSARNVDVDIINEQVVELLNETTEKTYTAIDSTENCDNGDMTDAILPEYLNTLNPPNFPPHKLRLRKNTVVMLIRNLNLSEGLCNGTRLMVLDLSTNVLRCNILTGDKAGEIVFINRITLYCDNVYPFTFKRRQFPIKIAFCMTINKAQGQTFDRIAIDLKKDVFNHGQLYVALSRVRSWQSLHLYLSSEKVDNSVKNFVFKELY